MLKVSSGTRRFQAASKRREKDERDIFIKIYRHNVYVYLSRLSQSNDEKTETRRHSTIPVFIHRVNYNTTQPQKLYAIE